MSMFRNPGYATGWAIDDRKKRNAAFKCILLLSFRFSFGGWKTESLSTKESTRYSTRSRISVAQSHPPQSLLQPRESSLLTCTISGRIRISQHISWYSTENSWGRPVDQSRFRHAKEVRAWPLLAKNSVMQKLKKSKFSSCLKFRQSC